MAKINLTNFNPLSGFEKFQPASIGMISELIKSAIIVPTLPVVTMYAPTIEEPTVHWDCYIKIVDNPLNGSNTVAYNIYEADGTFIMNVAKTAEAQEIKCPNIRYVFVTAVNILGFESPSSNLMEPASCFIAGTPVTMSGGYRTKAIETIVPGDIVQSYDFETGKYCNAEVEENVSGYTDQLAIVLFEDATSITMAAGHPLYTQDGFHSITNKDGYPTLVIGDKVLGLFGYLEIIDITIKDVAPTLVYSLSLKKGGGYFPGRPSSIATLVHNGGSN